MALVPKAPPQRGDRGTSLYGPLTLQSAIALSRRVASLESENAAMKKVAEAAEKWSAAKRAIQCQAAQREGRSMIPYHPWFTNLHDCERELQAALEAAKEGE